MNNKITSLVINVLIFALAIVSVIMIVLAMGTDAVVDDTTGLIKGDAANVSSAIDFTQAILIIALAAIVVFTLIAIASNPKRFIPTAIGIAVFGVLILIGWSLVEVETTGHILTLEGATPEALEWGGIGIKTTFVLVVVAVGLIAVQLVRNVLSYFTK